MLDALIQRAVDDDHVVVTLEGKTELQREGVVLGVSDLSGA
jgi:hypothetical protein